MSRDLVTDLVPFVHVRSVRDSVAFYGKLGFEVSSTFEPDGTLAWAFLQRACASRASSRGRSSTAHPARRASSGSPTPTATG